MVIKKFVAETFHEACEKIKDELGPDAMIVQTTKVKVGGFFGFFGRWVFEVVAQAAIPQGPLPQSTSQPLPIVEPTVPTAQTSAQPEAPLAVLPAIQQSQEISFIREELDDLKRKIELLVSVKASPPTTAQELAAPHGSINPPTCDAVVPPSLAETLALKEMMELLANVEIDPSLKGQIRTHLLETTPGDDLKNLRTLKDRVIEYLSRQLVPHQGIRLDQGQKAKVVAMIGPTGVGKTTTLAKLGAGLKFNLGLDVAFLTLDTYRIAAPEQLKKYGEIIDVPVEVVFRPENLQEAIQSFADKDVILVDTAGRSGKNRSDMSDLCRFLDCGYPVETYLVVSANTKYSDLVETLEDFKDLNPTNLILTKLDETSSFGTVISLLSKSKKAVSYVTTGQNVPEDIMPATPMRLAQLLFDKRLAA